MWHAWESFAITFGAARGSCDPHLLRHCIVGSLKTVSRSGLVIFFQSHLSHVTAEFRMARRVMTREVHIEESVVVRMFDVVKIVRRDDFVEASVSILDARTVPLMKDVVIVGIVEYVLESFMPWDVHTTHID